MSGDDHGQNRGKFRQRLDAVLRKRNPAELRAFLVGEGQWEPEAPTDEEAAMWMMIAASPVLADLHAEAERWLMAHGHEHEAQAILGRGQGGRPARGRSGAGKGAGAPARGRRGQAARPHSGGKPGATGRGGSGTRTKGHQQ